jgi:protein-arginine kinase activator protein McsA
MEKEERCRQAIWELLWDMRKRGYSGASHNSKHQLQQMWLDEIKRRRSSELPEKEFGINWVCYKCGQVYLVKTPFRKLYCSECLGKLLKGPSVLPLMQARVGYWTLEE